MIRVNAILPKLIALSQLVGFFVLPVSAQQYEWVRPSRGAPVSELGVSARYLLSPSVSFTGIGNMPFDENYITPGNIFEGEEKLIEYSDGFITQDYIAASLVDGAGFEGDRIPTSDGKSAAFFFFDESQRLNDGNQIAYHRYASVGDADFDYDGDAGIAMGWEINYTRFINRKRSLALQFGFSFNGFDSSFREDVTADLITQEFIHDITQSPAPELTVNTDSDGNVTSVDPFAGSQTREDDSPLINETPSSTSSSETEDGAIVSSDLELRSSMYNFRLGPLYNLNIGKAFSLRVGAGVSALYYSGRFSASEILSIEGGTSVVSRDSLTTDQTEWQIGPYVDASAYYNFTDRVSFFSGLQYQGGKEYNQFNEERSVEVDFSSQVYVQAGFGIKF